MLTICSQSFNNTKFTKVTVHNFQSLLVISRDDVAPVGLLPATINQSTSRLFNQINQSIKFTTCITPLKCNSQISLLWEGLHKQPSVMARQFMTNIRVVEIRWFQTRDTRTCKLQSTVRVRFVQICVNLLQELVDLPAQHAMFRFSCPLDANSWCCAWSQTQIHTNFEIKR